MKIGKSILCFALSGLLLVGYMMFVYNTTSFESNTNVAGTPYATQYNTFNSLQANSGVIIGVVAIVFAIAGIFFAADGLKPQRRGRRF